MFHAKRFNIIILLFILAVINGSLTAQEEKDETGNWLMYWGSNRISEKLGIWTEAQYRLYEVASNQNQLLLRTGLIYHLENSASLTAGYAYVKTWPFDEYINNSNASYENRIWEQLIMKNRLGRIDFEHRYRLEQRWVKAVEINYSNRMRYRFLLTVPFTNEKIIPETLFGIVYDEIFLNLGELEIFDQNRLFFALAYQFSVLGQVQVGYLFQTQPRETLERLQFAFVYNLDLR